MTDDDDPVTVGVGDGAGDGVVGGVASPPPQAIANIKIADTTTRRNEYIKSSVLPNLMALLNIPG